MNVLVTGGAGFIGSHLVEKLVKSNHEVTVYDNLQLDYGKISNLKVVADSVDVVRGDTRDFNSVTKATRSVEVVFHLAAISHLPLCRSNPLQAIETNTLGTLNILEASRLNNVKSVIFAGSDHVYGDAKYLPIDEGHPYLPKDAYSLSKVQAMELCRLYSEEYKLDTRVLISGNVFGEKQDMSKVVPIFITQALSNEPITVKGGGQTRGFYYVENLVDAYLLLMDHVINSRDKLTERVFNVDGELETSIVQLATLIRDITSSKSEIIITPYRYDENPFYRLFLSKLRIEELGYTESTKLPVGLEKTAGWYRENSNAL